MLEIDRQGRIRLSMKDIGEAFAQPETADAQSNEQPNYDYNHSEEN